uniref:GPI inositol-deacylase n=1 Tax=Acrobeloides nanus TaxID=290746 RepID=A0A914DDN0_9BILA
MNNFGPFRSHVNDCKMTYMWRYMNFMDTGFRYGNKYSLILYGEGFYAKDFMQTKKVNGIPVLFVPGNAGSARQVRSLGSVLQNKTEMQNTKFHFDVFAVDFNEELSGLSSEYISTQADYLSKAVDYIWKMYDKPPNGIIFVGHSMGGIAIRLLISDPGFDLNKAAMVLTFATPHRMPPLPIDHKMIQMWKKIHETWKTDRILNSHIRIISVSGGFKDELIDEIWTLDKNVTHVSTTEIDKVWLEADHQCIVWCNQLVRQTSRLLFDYARNPKNFFQKPQIYLDRHYKESGLRLKKIAPKNETKFLSADSCEPKCPPDGFLKIFVDEKLENKKLLVLSPLTYEPEQLIQIIDSNATERKCRPTTRFLKEDTFYSFINLQDCSGNTILVNLEKKLAWLVDNSDVYLPSFKVTWEKEITNLIWPLSNFRFNVDGVKILNISFYNNDLVARLDIIRDIEIEENDRHRAIWSTESVQRMDNPFAKNDPSKIALMM